MLEAEKQVTIIGSLQKSQYLYEISIKFLFSTFLGKSTLFSGELFPLYVVEFHTIKRELIRHWMTNLEFIAICDPVVIK
jgi:hypothetical protein